jgi:hypothetical protein
MEVVNTRQYAKIALVSAGMATAAFLGIYIVNRVAPRYVPLAFNAITFPALAIALAYAAVGP